MPAQRPWTAEERKITVLSAYWQYFLTLTFAQLGTRWGRIHRVENWLRWVARQGNTHRDRLLYVIRWECGEIGDRPHCHMFLGGMKDVSNPLSMCFILMDNWRKREGICQVRVFERARVGRGANYLGGRNDWDWGANSYEISKFGRTKTTVFFSRCAEETLKQIEGAATAQHAA